MSKPEQPTDPSLVPLIRAEETRLDQELEQTKTEAQARIAAARHHATLRIEQAQQQIPDVIGQTHTQEIQDLEAQTQAQKKGAQEAVTALEQAALKNMGDAINKILTLVLPEDKA